MTTKKTKKIENQTAEQARCERWEKEAVAVVDDDVVSVVVVVVVVVDDDDLFFDVIVIFVDCYDNDKKYQARCERWEKEAASTNATADHLEDQVLIVHVMIP